MQTPLRSTVSALALLQEQFPKQIILSGHDVASVFGYTYGSLRTLVCKGKFPIKPVDALDFDIRDVADYLDKLRAPVKKSTVGNKSKVAKAAAAMGLSEEEFLAQHKIEGV